MSSLTSAKYLKCLASFSSSNVASSQESVSLLQTCGDTCRLLLGELKKRPAGCRKATKIRKKAMEKISQTKGMSNF